MLAYIPALPFLGFLVLSLAGKQLSKNSIAWIGAGTVSAAAIIVILSGMQFLQNPPVNGMYEQLLWQWFRAGNLSVSISLRVDALSLVFIFIITFVGALIHIYSTAFMRRDHDYARFFACM